MKILSYSTGEAESELAGQKNWSQEHTPAEPRDNNRGTDEDETVMGLQVAVILCGERPCVLQHCTISLVFKVGGVGHGTLYWCVHMECCA
ncbi:hypothetical protein G5714_017329 [Onychostoma macrolepis]|uniref:Uncharacterized protein n=1 Tax=Onychostoma macrolepis TaxID=369639 RepID=A0A7J6C5G8_9TELE|nr:hypothetical protein G5714_017329 [Onychostoma macrolepis]